MKPLGLLVVVLSLAPAAVHAAPPPVTIARVKLTVQEPGWVVHEGPRYEIPIKNLHVDVVPGQSKILTLRDGQAGPVAAIAVFATWGSAGVSSWSDCRPVDGMYVRNLANSRFSEVMCLRFGGPYDAEATIAAGFGRFAEARKQGPLEVPASAYAIQVQMSTDDGTFIEINGFLDRGLVGLHGRQPTHPTPPNIEPAQAAWADVVAEAARASVQSLSGELAMPPTTFQTRPAARAVAAFR